MPTVKSLCNLARQSTRAESFERAFGLARHVLRHYPKSIETHCVLGEISSERGDIGEAERYFKLVLSADPENITAAVGLGIVYREQGSAEGAMVQFERALELQPDNARLRREILRLSSLNEDVPRDRIKLSSGGLGRVYLESGLYSRAAREFRAVYEADPSRLDAAVGLAEALWRAELFADAAQVCRSLLSIAPDCLKAKLLLAEMCYAGILSGDPEAMKAEARGLDPDNRLASRLFSGTSSAKRWPLPPADLPLPDESDLAADLEAWDEVDVEPMDLEPRLPAGSLSSDSDSLGMIAEPEEPEPSNLRHLSEAELRVAIGRMREDLATDTDNYPLRLTLAEALTRIHDIEGARREFEQLLAAAPEGNRQVALRLKELLAEGIEHPRLYRLLADAYLKDGAFTEAVEHYALALEKENK